MSQAEASEESDAQTSQPARQAGKKKTNIQTNRES